MSGQIGWAASDLLPTLPLDGDDEKHVIRALATVLFCDGRGTGTRESILRLSTSNDILLIGLKYAREAPRATHLEQPAV